MNITGIESTGEASLGQQHLDRDQKEGASLEFWINKISFSNKKNITFRGPEA